MTDVTIVSGGTQVDVVGVTLNSLTTTQRDALTAVTGMIIWNSTTTQVEQYNGSAWEATGQPIMTTHAALRTGVHGIVQARLAADHTLDSNSTTLQNVTGLSFAIAASEVWRAELFILGDSSGVADLKIGFSVPAGCTIDGIKNGVNEAGAGITGMFDEAQVPSLWGAGAGTPYANFLGHMLVINGSTAGNIQIQAAQNTAEVSTSKVLANSYIIANRLA